MLKCFELTEKTVFVISSEMVSKYEKTKIKGTVAIITGTKSFILFNLTTQNIINIMNQNTNQYI
jgi:hypothetical protein